MRILITGGTGYLGRGIVDYFSGSKHDVRVLVHNINTINSMPENIAENIELVEGDILSDTALDNACKDVDAIIHLAALDSAACKENPKDAPLVNGIGTRNLVIAASKNNVKRFIYVSTFHIYGKFEGDIDEDTLPNPKDDYAITKLLGEYYCKNYSKDMSYTILRLSNVFGFSKATRGGNLVVNDLTKQCIMNKEIVLKSSGSQKRNFVAMKDVIDAINIVLGSKQAENKTFNVAGPLSISIKELAERIAKIYAELYEDDILIRIPINTEKNIVSDLDFKYDKIAKLGYNPTTPLDSEIKRLLKEFSNTKN